MKVNKDQILESLKNIKSQISALGVNEIGLFGSFVRGEESPDSDIDIFIAFDPEMERFSNLMKLYDLLEDTFKERKIDVVTHNGLSPHTGPRILQEVEYVTIDE